MALQFPTMAERPDLRPRGRDLVVVWPEFMLNDPVCNRLFGRVRTELEHLQFFAWDEDGDDLLDRERDHGLYVEPNVWMVHRLKG